MIALLFIAAVVSANVPAAAPSDVKQCASNSADQVLVCGRTTGRYRIDPWVIEAAREHDALPPKPAVTADAVPGGGCVGGEGCTGGVVPLIGIALVAVKAAALAANGDDWRDAIRTHEDEYRLYKAAEKRRASERRPRIGFGVRN